MSRYHIVYGDKLVLKDGSTVRYEDVELVDPTHEYDVGTRLDYGVAKKETEPKRFLEDYMEENFVAILETGSGAYKHKRGEEYDDADN